MKGGQANLTVNDVIREAVAETSFQLASCQETSCQEGIAATLGILQAIANAGDEKDRLMILETLEGYAIPFCALQIQGQEDILP